MINTDSIQKIIEDSKDDLIFELERQLDSASANLRYAEEALENVYDVALPYTPRTAVVNRLQTEIDEYEMKVSQISKKLMELCADE